MEKSNSGSLNDKNSNKTDDYPPDYLSDDSWTDDDISWSDDSLDYERKNNALLLAKEMEKNQISTYVTLHDYSSSDDEYEKDDKRTDATASMMDENTRDLDDCNEERKKIEKDDDNGATCSPLELRNLTIEPASITMESFAAFFLSDNGAAFGAYPTTDRMRYLVDVQKMNVVVDLTNVNESRCKPYDVPSSCERIRFPIIERSVPSDIASFCKLILTLYDAIVNKWKNVYIHCKGGHGRSAVVAAVLLGYIRSLDGKEAIRLTTAAHNTRTDLNRYWLRVGAPHTLAQKLFVTDMLKPVTLPLETLSSKKEDDEFLASTRLGMIKNDRTNALKRARESLYLSYREVEPAIDIASNQP